MKRYILALGAASALVLAGVAGAGQQLTSAQMDGITAGGAATGTAAAAAYGILTSITHSVNTQSVSTAINPGELGAIYSIASHTDSGAAATAQGGGTAFAGGASVGDTTGTGLSDTDNNTTATASMLQDLTATPPLLPFAMSSANGTGTATSVYIGLTASSVGASTAASTLGN